MNISIVIPNYNGAELLKENLPKLIEVLKSYKKGEWEVIIVDDGSIDDSLSAVPKDANIKVLQNEKNMGFSPTVNKGVRHATGDVVVLLNNDVVPEKDFLTPLLSHFKDEKVFAVGCMDKSVEGDEIVLRGRGIGKWQRGFLVHAAGSLDKKNTLWASGGSSAFSKKLWEKISGMNEIYAPFYWEDIDLSYRAWKSGFTVLFEKKAVVVHEHERGAIKKNFSAAQVKKIAYRNQFLFVWINADISIVFSHLLWLPYHFIKAFLRGDLSFFKGFFAALLRFGRAIKTRSRVKRSFVKSDAEVVAEFAE